MNTDTGSFRRIAAITAASAITAITTTFAAQPATATAEPPSDRPCFIAQPRWNTAIDGPPPTCPTPAWQQQATDDAEAPTQKNRHRIEFDDEYAAESGD